MNVPPTLKIRLKKDGTIDRRWKGASNKPAKNHPWKRPFSSSPESHKRSLEHGYRTL